MAGVAAPPQETPPTPLDTAAPERPILTWERGLKESAYVAIGLLLGPAYLVLLVGGILVGALLGVVWLGLPLVLAAVAAVWRCAALERTLANVLLEARIPPLRPVRVERDGTGWRRVRGRLSGGPFWRAVAMLALRLPAAALAAALSLAGVAVVVGLVVFGVEGIVGADHGFIGPFSLGPPLGVALILLAAPAAVATAAIGHGSVGALRSLAWALLATPLPPGTPVRETLAQSLGDRSLTIAYWLPERETFVDERGRPVPLPEPGSGRAWTAVDYDGRRVAAIIHDVSLEASRELVQAAAAAASLALDNEQLKADLRARLEELRASRVRIVQATYTARRRIERDLHDGAQQQLVALAIDLKMLRSRVGSNRDALELIDQIDDKLSAALDELRELARGIHPAILTERGLEPALESLAARAPVPVACDIDLPTRPPAAVEAAAYFVVAEALTNVTKYAHATSAAIRARQADDEIVVELADDGVGGADVGRGSGLVDRVGALEGTLTAESPPGEGTLVRARLPCRAGDLVAEANAAPEQAAR